MARIPYADPESLSAPARKAVGDAPINVTRMLAGASEGVFTGFIAFSGSFFSTSPLPPTLREIAILRVGYLRRSRYETFQHEALAAELGLSQAQIGAIRAGGSHPDVFSPAEQAVCDFTEDIVQNVRASDATLAAVRQHLPDQQVIDLILVIGSYVALCGLLETTGVDLDAAPVDWAHFDLTRRALAEREG